MERLERERERGVYILKLLNVGGLLAPVARLFAVTWYTHARTTSTRPGSPVSRTGQTDHRDG